ncbi:unannotated protein [freshwater metagenome]|uniref:Unannotated protein n=1 Tax=freshwater metagenome TaxID=449393 RepID=A0A6J6Y951_9ZZZZ|nr:hypothetical protein [Actinomycetota bacterium]MSX74647.1 hypothetical protein [Actinomycetota bacterium]
MQQRGEKGLWVLAIGISAVVGFAIAGFPGIRSQDADALPTTTVERSSSVATSSTTSPSASTTSTTTPTTTVIASTRSTAAAPIVVVKSPQELTVRVGNGTRTSGAAAKVSEQLAAQGYTTRTPTDAKVNDLAATTVYYRGPHQAEAEVLANAIGLSAMDVLPITDPSPIEPDGAELIVIVGTNQAG